MNLKALLILAALTALFVMLCLSSLFSPADDRVTQAERSFDRTLTIPTKR